MRKFLSTTWDKVRDIFGIRKNSKYVANFLNEANMRSGIFMSGVIFVLEAWLLIRQTDKYIIPTLSDPANTFSVFRVVFTNTSNFWLLLSFGAAMFAYCLAYHKLEGKRKRLIPIIVLSGISLVFCALMPFEFIYASRAITGVKLFLLIAFYVGVFVFDVAVITTSIYQYKGGKNSALTSVLIISLFAFVCLAFGVKVSYSDFSSVKTVTIDGVKTIIPNPDYKEIICFLMMAMYVGCLLIWKPYVSIGILGAVFLGFFLLLENTVDPEIRKFPEGDQVNYITFFISLTMICISIYNQRINEAKKDEELEILATKDVLTDLTSFNYFVTLVNKKIKEDNLPLDGWIYLFVNITGFKIFNDQRGFERGNALLKKVGEVLSATFQGIISRQADDHFIVFAKNESIEEKVSQVNKALAEYDPDIKPTVKVGGYIYHDPVEDSRVGIEKARYACAELEEQFGDYLTYDLEMHNQYRLAQHVVHRIDDASAYNHIKAYYQPVVSAKERKLCGVEALARWDDPKYGFLYPNKFVPALEAAQLIYKLDIAMLNAVCRDIRNNMDRGIFVVPVSINFSRMDFFAIDVVSKIEEIVNEYRVPKDLLHIEITESALTDDSDVLKNAVKRLHELGYAVWLDDFGSGYSSFNVLKDFDFDVVKLDMAFLSSFGKNKKQKTIIKSVVALAHTIGMSTLSEGVETEEEADFLESIGVERLQGYLYGKPMSYDDLKKKVDNKELSL